MDDTTPCAPAGVATFEEKAAAIGIKPRMLYPLRVVAKVTGYPYQTLVEEVAAGRLKYFLPAGRRQGKMVRPEWVDEWMREGTHEDGF